MTTSIDTALGQLNGIWTNTDPVSIPDASAALADGVRDLLSGVDSASGLVEGWVMAYRGTTTQRNAYSTADLEIGYRWQDTTDLVTYRWNGAAWKEWESDWITATAPTITAGTGTFTSTTATLRYKYSAGAVLYLLAVVITDAGTAGGALRASGLPFTALNSYTVFGRETVGTGLSLTGTGSGNLVDIVLYSNATVIASGRTINVTGSVEV